MYLQFFTHILIVSLVNIKKQTLAETGVNQLLKKLVATENPQIRTTEAPLAVSTGSNLSVDGVLSINEENFLAISEASFYEDIKSKEHNEANGKSLFNRNDLRLNVKKPSALIWDNCKETNLKDDYENYVRPLDMEMVVQDTFSRNDRDEVKKINSTWNKRDVNKTTVMNAWLQKYNSLLNSKMEERRQQKTELLSNKKLPINEIPTETTSSKTSIVKSTETDLLTTSTTSAIFFTTVPIIPITREVLGSTIEPSKITENVLTESNIKAGFSEDWFDIKSKETIRFSSLPQRTTYLIPTLRLEDGFHPFSFMSKFFYLIYPFDFPVGLIKDIFWGEITFPYSFLQSIKVESTFLGFIILFACIALVIPSYLFILAILSLFSKSRCDDEMETGALFPEAEGTDCNDRILVVTTLFLVLLCCVLITGMAVSNEQAYHAASSAHNFVNCACADIATWLATVARELHHSLVPPVDLVLHAFKDDLRNTEALLGDPIQQAIASESGIDLVFDSLADIIEESGDISTKISSLRDVSIKAGGLASATSDRIKDLARQLDSLKKHCTIKDMPLCDTINTNSLDVRMKFDSILHEQQLLELRTIGVENLTRAISTARQEFKALPSAINTQTSQIGEDIIKNIEVRRQAVHNSVKVLSDIVRHLTANLQTTARKLESGLHRVQKYEFGRWSVMLACIVILGSVAALILMALLCGCGHTKIHAHRTLKLSAAWICVVSLILWGMISAIFLITGHAEIYICHALWDEPQYQMLTELLDRRSPLFTNNEGVFDALFHDLENTTIEVSVKDVLRDCEKDRPAYIVFQLDKILDVNKETSYFEWTEMQSNLARFSSAVDVGLLKTISVNFNKLLTEMLRISNVDLAKYRMDYNVPVVGRDLPSLVDQLENVAAQVTDLTTAGRLESLATRTQRLHITSIKPLEQLRAEVVFKLTELELQLMPFRRKLNISLSHIHTAQYYIDNQGDFIARKKISSFMSRVVSHAAGWRTHVIASVGKHAARCRPLFNVFSATRSLFCTHYIAALHGWWVCGIILGIIWCTSLTPICVKLWRVYGRKIKAQEAINLVNLSSGAQGTPTTAPCDGSNWNTPGPPAPPLRSDSW